MKKILVVLVLALAARVSAWQEYRPIDDLTRLSDIDETYSFCHVVGRLNLISGFQTVKVSVSCDGEFVYAFESESVSDFSPIWTEVIATMRRDSALEYAGCRMGFNFVDNVVSEIHYCDFLNEDDSTPRLP